MEQVLRIYEAILANEVSKSFALAIAAVFGLAVLARLPALARALGGLDRSGAALLTTIGVLGTFTGIFLGLLDFDVKNIDRSVPALLVGLKIAFVTSILGMAAAIVLKFIQVVTPQPITAEAEVTPEVIHATLSSINDSIKDSSTRQREALEDLRKSISADSDSSLLTQIQKLRTDLKDDQNELIKEFHEFAVTMAENNSKALIEALEQVIRDFNTQLNEQFGDNFRQLNEAVGALLKWQENYREHVELLERRIEFAVQGIQSAERVLREIATHTERIPETLSDMQELLDGFAAANLALTAHLDAISSLKDKALEAFPLIDRNLKKLTDDFGSAVREAVSQSADAIRNQREAHQDLQSGYGTLLERSHTAQDEFEKAWDSSLQSMNAALHRSMEAHAQAIDVAANEMKHQIDEAWRRTSESIETQIENLDQQMQQELNRSVEIMGRNLASLSEKFVEDYEPLTDKLRNLVQMGARI